MEHIVSRVAISNNLIIKYLVMSKYLSLSLQGSAGEIVGVVDYWVRLFNPAEPVDTVVERGADRRTATQRSPVHISLGWQDTSEVKEMIYVHK